MCNINKNIENTAQVFIHSQIPHKDQSKDQKRSKKKYIIIPKRLPFNILDRRHHGALPHGGKPRRRTSFQRWFALPWRW